MNWTPKNEARLAELWADPANSAAEIGRLMHVSKNAIVGKCHRLGLPPRPSPLIRSSETRGPGRIKGDKPNHAPRVTLPALIPAAEPSWTPADIVVVKPLVPTALTRACTWPMWGNGRPTHIYCEKPTNRRWCAEHWRIGHTRVVAAGLRAEAA